MELILERFDTYSSDISYIPFVVAGALAVAVVAGLFFRQTRYKVRRESQMLTRDNFNWV